MDNMKKDEAQDQKHDELAESLNDLFTSVSTMIKSELQVKSPILSPSIFQTYFWKIICDFELVPRISNTNKKVLIYFSLSYKQI